MLTPTTKQTAKKSSGFFICLLMLLSACQVETIENLSEPGFQDVPVINPVIAGFIDEASGIAHSHADNGSLWVQQDSGNPPELTLISQAGKFLKKVAIKNATNRDWEDLAISKDAASGKDFIYLADIGDNNQTATSYFIYRFQEPDENATEVNNAEKFTFKYSDGSHDAEAILVDNLTHDIYIITKRGLNSRIYILPSPQSTSSENTASYVGSLNYTGVTSAAMSADGKEIIVKTYTNLYYYKRKAHETIAEAIQKAAVSLSYTMEPQGEAVCFKNDNSGFFTISEKGLAPFVDLRFYKRK